MTSSLHSWVPARCEDLTSRRATETRGSSPWERGQMHGSAHDVVVCSYCHWHRDLQQAPHPAVASKRYAPHRRESGCGLAVTPLTLPRRLHRGQIDVERGCGSVAAVAVAGGLVVTGAAAAAVLCQKVGHSERAERLAFASWIDPMRHRRIHCCALTRRPDEMSLKSASATRKESDQKRKQSEQSRETKWRTGSANKESHRTPKCFRYCYYYSLRVLFGDPADKRRSDGN